MINKLFKTALCLCVIAFTSCSSDDDNPQEPLNIIIDGAAIAPEIGGPNQQNQVYIDLSTNTTTSVQRDSWDLGFYSGNDFRVVINGSIAMATTELYTTDIDAITSSTQEVIDLQPQVKVGTFDSSNLAYVDTFDGNINGTAIEQISDIDSENSVYLVNLGNEVGTDIPATGVSLDGEERGWIKVRILKEGNNYILQYADLDATTHNEVTISKSANYNFTFFSFNTESIVNVEPLATKWDLNFSVFTDEVFAGPDSYGAYIYADFVSSNNLENVGIYMIDTEENTELSYDNFTLLDVDAFNFSTDRRAIGSSWRNGGGPGTAPSLKDNVFYIVNDTDGNLYKLQFLALTNSEGVRGYPEFVYSLLQ
ncbi:HmuY family protein [Psychroserpens ponticola]|uniref:HmuY family protein n=1 Tax=Psychroserpens ponticola TaxID=2932268 RepID=A0ABY7RZV4_9FLAO|nr:HmuY family protein [Psychroserpens ponticola]WCO02664.1 HmuY family protein [Psychroserpens ponticola]